MARDFIGIVIRTRRRRRRRRNIDQVEQIIFHAIINDDVSRADVDIPTVYLLL